MTDVKQQGSSVDETPPRSVRRILEDAYEAMITHGFPVAVNELNWMRDQEQLAMRHKRDLERARGELDRTNTAAEQLRLELRDLRENYYCLAKGKPSLDESPVPLTVSADGIEVGGLPAITPNQARATALSLLKLADFADQQVLKIADAAMTNQPTLPEHPLMGTVVKVDPGDGEDTDEYVCLGGRWLNGWTISWANSHHRTVTDLWIREHLQEIVTLPDGDT